MPLRVIAGSAGGRVLKGPRSNTRPTSDRVREALFEIIASHDLHLGRVLDLYSGTGALGIEALSRGAEHCDFVEADARTCEIIRQNLALTGLKGRGHVWHATVARALGRLGGPYDLVVADPPYEYDRAQVELATLATSGLLSPEATIAVEHSKRKEWPEELGGKETLLSRRYGDTVLTLYR
jgi:16S rRNA (guanine966-N2)-methyltransferase